jgi:hypothetical protein
MLEPKPGRRPFVPFHERTLEAFVRAGSFEDAADDLGFDDPAYTIFIHACVWKALADLPDDSDLREKVRLVYRQHLLDEALSGLSEGSPMWHEAHRFYEERPR